MAWQKETDYGLRLPGETTIFRIRALTEGKVSARTFGAQKSEIRVMVAIAHKAIRAAKPISERVQ